MAGNFSKVDEFSRVIAGYSDAQLEEVAPDYIWLAEVGPEVARANFVSRRDMIVEECERRGMPEIIERARERAAGNQAAEQSPTA